MEVRIIRTCRLAVGAVSALLLASAPAAASRAPQGELLAYVRARAAGSLGADDRALRDYSASLAFSPGNKVVATGALRQALAAGERDLAVKAARTLEQAGAVAPDVRFVLLTEAVRTGNWAEANRNIDLLADDQVFAFVAPVLRAWVAVGSRQADPIAILHAGASDQLAGSYIAEHRPLILLALGREPEGLVEVRNRSEAHDTRTQRLVVSAAARLAREGKRDQALALLGGDEPAIVNARGWLDKHDRLPGEIATPAQGVAEFFLRIAIDLRRQDVGALALSFARLSTFLETDYSEGWLVTSQLLAGQDDNRQALAVLRNIPASDPSAGIAKDVRIGLLAALGDNAAALKEAKKEVKARDAAAADWMRLGDLYSQLERHPDAADAYARALKAPGAESLDRPTWAVWLLLGGARDRSGQWPQAKEALETAYRLAPGEPLVLNYLGYAQLERRENIDAAEKLISEANRLQPDSAQITDSLGWAHYLQGDYARAIELLERAVQGEPTDSAINEHLGDAYYSAGRRYEARYAWGAALVTADAKDVPRIRAKIENGLTPELASP